jgi:murein DD-endopeptidase MepM/ murein hydrolase activator NlpD
MILCPVKSPCRITQHFGARPEVYKQFGLRGHNGVDFTGARPGELVPVFSPYDAVVHEVGDQGDKGYGKFVRLRTAPDVSGSRREVILAHLSVVSVKPGDGVRLGDAVGVMGNTGFSSALHLHLGLRRIGADGSEIDGGNGYSGYFDFEPYLLFWKGGDASMVTYPNG